jgi:hypothetical protein
MFSKLICIFNIRNRWQSKLNTCQSPHGHNNSIKGEGAKSTMIQMGKTEAGKTENTT